jgi:ribonuclease HII
MAGVLVSEEQEEQLKKLGVKDSKKHTPARRKELFGKIQGIATDFAIEIVTPEQIDAALNDPDNNLNWLEAIYIAKIINKLKPDKVYADCPSNNVEAFTNFVRKNLEDKDVELVVEHKADENYVSSSAASILAKVTRDREVSKLRKQYGDFGSGYPSDPRTKRFIEKDNSLPIFRKTWSTWKSVEAKKKQSSLSDF